MILTNIKAEQPVNSHTFNGQLTLADGRNLEVVVSRRLHNFNVNLVVTVEGFTWHDDKITEEQKEQFANLMEAAHDNQYRKAEARRRELIPLIRTALGE